MSLSVGIVGAGEVSRQIHLPVLCSMPEVRVAWIHDRDTRRCQALAQAYGIAGTTADTPQALPPADVVLLAIPVEARGTYLDAFAAGQTAVLCEKPFATTAASHRGLTERYSPERLGCGYMRRFYDSSQILRDVVARGWFGGLRRLRIAEGNRSRG